MIKGYNVCGFVVNCFCILELFVLFCFNITIFHLGHNTYSENGLQIAVFWASLIFQQIFTDTVSN